MRDEGAGTIYEVRCAMYEGSGKEDEIGGVENEELRMMN